MGTPVSLLSYNNDNNNNNIAITIITTTTTTTTTTTSTTTTTTNNNIIIIIIIPAPQLRLIFSKLVTSVLFLRGARARMRRVAIHYLFGFIVVILLLVVLC